MNKNMLPIFFFLIGLVSFSSAFSQEDIYTSDKMVLEEITVTAERREESLTEVPISIAVLGKEKLEQKGIDEIEDLGNNVPNLYVNPFNVDADSVRIFVRGIGQGSVEVTQDPSVALYMNGVYAGSSIGLGFENADIERIEVLRGPQGTLYGRNATGGAINIITEKPTLGEFNIKQMFSHGNLGNFKSKTKLNVPLGEGGIAAAKLTYLNSERRDGLVENTGLGENWGVQDRDAYRFDLRIQPTDALTIDYAYDKSYSEDTDNFGQLTAASSMQGNATDPINISLPDIPIPIPGTPFTQPLTFSKFSLQPTIAFTASQPAQQSRVKRFSSPREIEANELEVSGQSLTFSFDASDNITIKSITSKREKFSSGFSDGIPGVNAVTQLPLLEDFEMNLGGYLPIIDWKAGEYIEDNIGELLDGIDELIDLGIPLPVDIDLTGVADLFQFQPGAMVMLRRDTKFEELSQEFQLIGDASWNTLYIDYVAGIYYYKEEADQVVDIGTAGGLPRIPGDITQIENENHAIYGQTTLTPGGEDGRWHFTFGGRYSEDKRQALRINPNSLTFGQSAPDGANYDETFYNFNPSLTVAYDLNEYSNVYAKVLTGYRSGGTSEKSSDPDLFSQGVDVEEIISYELGFKGLLLESRLELNLALFNMKIDGYQTSIQSGSTPGDRDLFGLDNTKSKGIEIDARALITDYLTLSLGLGLLDTKISIDSVTIPSLIPGSPDIVRELEDTLPYAPERTGSVALDYQRNIGSLFFAGYLGYNYQGDKNASPNKEDQIVLKGYSLLDASFTLSEIPIAAGNLAISLWGKNLTNKEYALISTRYLDALDVSVLGDPRTYGLSVIYEY
ncbi:MAG: TonB-dependent receptor [Gammaproteobacteria bacterium]|nr:TonB-dependent receptor [Gammaproteobacteria bacterium]